MKDGLFEASDCNASDFLGEMDSDGLPAEVHCISLNKANTLLAQTKEQWLAELLRDAPVVYGIGGVWCIELAGVDTHSARLVDIKEIKGGDASERAG